MFHHRLRRRWAGRATSRQISSAVPKQKIWKTAVDATKSWHKKNSLPSLPLRQVEQLWDTSWPLHESQISNHITHRDIARFQQLFPNAVLHNEDRRATSLRIYIVHASISNVCRLLSPIPSFFENWTSTPWTSATTPSTRSDADSAKHTIGLWVLVVTYQMPTSYQNGKNNSDLADRLSASFPHHSDLCILCRIVSPNRPTNYPFPTT